MIDNSKVQTDFINLIEDNKKLIYKISFFYCDCSVDKEDLFQEIILNLWIAFPYFKNKSKISTWIYRVAFNTAISWVREYTKQNRTIKYTSLIPNLPIESDESDADELYTRLYKAINTLGDIDKAIILLLLDEYSYDEIAEIVGLTKTNIATKINRIKVKLRSQMFNV
ncbi:MAG: RNA polymerase sigma factor [Porphyromonadaceae bacterium]|nr:RNA polymerase sigma factor [uncultured Macellibacteroides sp.]MCE5224936.1 RNA polymerase sigma factor [Porphyromonadaceae bacterium]